MYETKDCVVNNVSYLQKIRYESFPYDSSVYYKAKCSLIYFCIRLVETKKYARTYFELMILLFALRWVESDKGIEREVKRLRERRNTEVRRRVLEGERDSF